MLLQSYVVFAIITTMGISDSSLPHSPFRCLIVECWVINPSNESSQVHLYTVYKHAITLNSDDSASSDYLALIVTHALVLCSIRFHHLRKAHQSYRFNEACVFTLAHYGLLTRYPRTYMQTSRFTYSHEILFLSLPPE